MTETYGESLIRKLLDKLDREDYFSVAEPRIETPKGPLHPDFVLVIRNLGILVIEVKDYLDLKPNSNQKTIFINQKNGAMLEKENPQETARNYAEMLSNELQKRHELLRNKKLLFPWQNIVIFPNMPRKVVHYYQQIGIFSPNIIWSREDVSSVDALKQAIQKIPWKFQLQGKLSDSVINTLRGVLNPSLKILNENNEDIGTLTPLQEFLSSESLEVIENQSVRLLRGVAGSGKSLVLVKRAQWLVQHYPEHKILVLTFNKLLQEQLERQLFCKNIEVKTFHAQCRSVYLSVHATWKEPYERLSWIKENCVHELAGTGLSPEFVDEEIKYRKEMGLTDNHAYLTVERRGRGQNLIQEKRKVINEIFSKYIAHQQSLKSNGFPWEDWEDVPSHALAILQRNHSPFRGYYDAVLIDEAQDFAPQWIHITKLQVKPNGTFFVCDDPTQSIFRHFSWQEKGLSVVGRAKILRIPFRNTRQIASAAYALVESDAIINQTDIPRPFLESEELIDGVKPILLKCKNVQDEIHYIHSKIISIQQECPDAKIAILCPAKSRVKEFADWRKQDVFVDSFKRMKGLEFDIVFIPGLCRLFESQGEDNDSYSVAGKRRELFTAMTRAKNRLFMSYFGNLPKELDGISDFVFKDYHY